MGLPDNVEKYGETAIFTETTVPAKLTSAHDTKHGVWGRLMVLDGALDYIIIGPPESRRRIGQGEYAVVEPAILHWIGIRGPVRFKVEFHRRPE